MPMKNPRLLFAGIPVVPVLTLGACLALAAQAQTGTTTNTADYHRFSKLTSDDLAHHVYLGAVASFNISAEFKLSGTHSVSGTGTPAVFDDGYVLVDDTGNAGGRTSNWGYNDPSQVSGSNLKMHGSSSFDATSSTKVDQDYAFGLEVGYGDAYWRWGRTQVGWQFGFGWLPLGITDTQNLPVSLNQSVYTFDTGGIVVPTAPYHGTAVSAGAPSILAAPTQVSAATVPGTLSSSQEIDGSLFTFKLGPTLYFDLSRRFGLYASAGPALGLVTGDYKYNETLTGGSGSAPNSGSAGLSSVVFGGYASAMVVYHLPTEKADIYLGAQYLPLGDTTTTTAGREAHLNLSGQVTVSAGVNWRF
jgi:hypothetical protein